MATAFTLPAATKMNAINIVTSDALKGSFVPFSPLLKNRLNFIPGKAASFPRAWSVRGATIIAPRAEDIVEAANPSGIIICPPVAISDIINCSLINFSGEAECTSFRAINI